MRHDVAGRAQCTTGDECRGLKLVVDGKWLGTTNAKGAASLVTMLTVKFHRRALHLKRWMLYELVSESENGSMRV